MGARNFRELLENCWNRNSFVCVGLDSEYSKIPDAIRNSFGNSKDHLRLFNSRIVEATHDLVCAYKLNTAFYEAHGSLGIEALRETIRGINICAPTIPVILDAKRADIGNTNAGYVGFAFDYLQADAITVHPYLGREALEPFLSKADKGIFVLCRTSNPGAGEIQDKRVGVHWSECEVPLYMYVAWQVSRVWNQNSNCGLVVGATYPNELAQIRSDNREIPILIPGIGAQGGDVETTVASGKDSRERGMIINSSRGIIFASQGEDFAEAARRETEKLRNLINICLNK